MNQCWISSEVLISPLGESIDANLQALRNGISGIQIVPNSGFNGENWPLAKISNLPEENRYSALLEKTLNQLQNQFGKSFFENPRTAIVLSTTKADIQSLPNDTFASTFRLIREKLHSPNEPIVISNACISGVLAINIAADCVQSGEYEHAIVIGIDILSDFVVYGFQSLFALSDSPTQPFDGARKGINLGEASAVVLVSATKPTHIFSAEWLAGSSSNDANHISGPSRTGEGLVRTITKTITQSSIDFSDIDFISAHGTGTIYNDEMESIALSRVGLSTVPTNSLKGCFGHTLGAAGILETIVCLLSMEHNEVYSSLGFEQKGTSEEINIIPQLLAKKVDVVLKTASGFGGGNASLVLRKT